jgi:hypothetical protein
MNKPYIICHMMTAVDGRIDCAMTEQLPGVQEYYSTLDSFDAPTWVSGRVTAEFALMAQGITDSSLKFHLQNAKNHGVTKKEIAAIVTHTAFYAGWPKAWAVFNLAKEVWRSE